jgi:hypothetical protein
MLAKNTWLKNKGFTMKYLLTALVCLTLPSAAFALTQSKPVILDLFVQELMQANRDRLGFTSRLDETELVFIYNRKYNPQNDEGVYRQRLLEKRYLDVAQLLEMLSITRFVYKNTKPYTIKSCAGLPQDYVWTCHDLEDLAVYCAALAEQPWYCTKDKP